VREQQFERRPEQMAQYSMTKALDAPAERVWATASDVSVLAKWLPTTHESHAAGGERVQLTGDSHGHPYDTAAPVHADEQAHRLSWSAPDGPAYAGWLQVSGDSAHAEVTLSLEIADERPAAAHGDEVQRGMSEALDRLAELSRG
jgi:uncharacterized protein YndB with AHSA1/START domain